MRDVVRKESTVVFNQSRNTYYPNPGWSYPSSNSQSQTHIREASGRSDSIPSDGIRSTPYSAYRILSDPQEFTLGNETPGGSGYYHFIETHEATGLRALDLQRSGVGLSPSFGPIVDAQIVAESRTKALNRLANSDVNFGQTLGEAKQTAGLMHSTLINVVEFLKRLLRKDYIGAAASLGLAKSTLGSKGRSRLNAAKSFGDAYLVFKFGFLPIVNDLFNGRQAIIDAFSRDEGLIKVKGQTVRDGRSALQDLASYYKFSGTYLQGCEVGILARVDKPFLAGLNRLGVANPLALAWELLPLSFVVNWFISIGNFLSALSATWGLSVVDAYETKFVRSQGLITEPKWVIDKPWEYGNVPSWKIKSFAMSRSVNTTGFPPGLYMKSDWNFGKASTLLALILQRTPVK